MLDYTNFFEKPPVIILNVPGKIVIDNKNSNHLIMEVDYNSFPKEILDKIKSGKEEVFEKATNCITYDENKIKQKYMPIMINNNGVKSWKNILSENNSINFSMIKNKIDILKNDKLLKTIGPTYSKKISFELGDGEYVFSISTYNTDDELVFNNNINVQMKTNYHSLNATKNEEIKIHFNKDEGNFDLMLAANSKRLYSFKIVDIYSENDSIFEFSYYNSSSNDKNILGKIGSEFNLINKKQADEIVKNPIQEQLIKPTFVFNINELFTTKYSKDDIGVVRFPTIREKIKDTFLPYYNLKCDVSQNYSVDLDKSDDLLVTDKFNNYPLFYKFFIDVPFDSLKIIDSNNKEVTDYIVDKISDEVNIVYFNPLRNQEYYYIVDNDPPLHINYRKSIKSYKMVFDEIQMSANDNKIEFEFPTYFGDLMIKGNGEYEVEIQLSDYSIKTFTIKAVDKKFEFLEDERVKINNKIKYFKVKTKDKISVISMICNFKNNRLNYSFFKNNFKDFVYIANEVGTINLNQIPDKELSKFNTNKKYIFKDGIISEVQNGPLYLESIKKQDIVFTDIEEWLKEHSIGELEVVNTSLKDKFFLKNVFNPVRELRYEDK